MLHRSLIIQYKYSFYKIGQPCSYTIEHKHPIITKSTATSAEHQASSAEPSVTDAK